MLTPTTSLASHSTAKINPVQDTFSTSPKEVMPSPKPLFPDEEFNKETDRVLHSFAIPSDVSRLICAYQRPISMKFTEKNFNRFVELFSKDGNQTFKRAFIKKAIEVSEINYLNNVFDEIINQFCKKYPERCFTPVGANLRSVDLGGLNLKEINKRGVNFSNCRISGELLTDRFTSVRLEGAILTGHFKNVRHFNGATITDASIEFDTDKYLTFHNSTMVRVKMPPAIPARFFEFITANLTDIDLSHRCFDADFDCAVLTRVNMESSTLTSRSIFFNTTFVDVNVAHANLSGVKLNNAKLINVNISEASSVQGMTVSDQTMEGLNPTEKQFLLKRIEEGIVIKTPACARAPLLGDTPYRKF